jgi:alpha-glucosidase
LVVANLGQAPAALPDGADLLATSGELRPDGQLPTDTTAWLRVSR